MAILPKELDTKDLVSGYFTVEVRLKRKDQWAWRLSLALFLFELGCKIAWLDYELVAESKEVTCE